jgi:hypothetical protein
MGLPQMKLSSLLCPVWDSLGQWTPGVYRIPCEFFRVYTGLTGRSVNTRLKENQRHIRLEHPDKSVLAEHSISRHRTQFQSISIHTTKATRTTLLWRPMTLNSKLTIRREGGFCLSKSLMPLICSLKTFGTWAGPLIYAIPALSIAHALRLL